MNNHRCISQKSLISIQKWLLESGDNSLSSKFHNNNNNIQYLNKIIKRKKFHKKKSYSKTTSIMNWFYEFIKKIFTIYEENQLKYDKYLIDDTTTTTSIMTCSTCQLENIDSNIEMIETKLKSNKSNSRIMITTTTNNSNLNISKSTQTNHNEQQSIIYPLYCFSIKDGQILPLMLSSPSSSTVIPIIKDTISSLSPLSIDHQNSEYYNKALQLSDIPINSPLITNIHSNTSFHPTIKSITSSNSISLQTTKNFLEDNKLIKISRPSTSLHDTRICHFDKRNCLIECYHESNNEKNFHQSLNTNTSSPEIIFAESTCQLIKQAWLSSTTDQ